MLILHAVDVPAEIVRVAEGLVALVASVLLHALVHYLGVRPEVAHQAVSQLPLPPAAAPPPSPGAAQPRVLRRCRRCRDAHTLRPLQLLLLGPQPLRLLRSGGEGRRERAVLCGRAEARILQQLFLLPPLLILLLLCQHRSGPHRLEASVLTRAHGLTERRTGALVLLHGGLFLSAPPPSNAHAERAFWCLCCARLSELHCPV